MGSMRPEDAILVIKRPLVTEKTYDPIEKQNKITFIVKEGANKKLIADAIETLYEVEVQSVNTARTVYGKKAYVRLAPKSSAADLGSRLGLV